MRHMPKRYYLQAYIIGNKNSISNKCIDTLTDHKLTMYTLPIQNIKYTYLFLIHCQVNFGNAYIAILHTLPVTYIDNRALSVENKFFSRE